MVQSVAAGPSFMEIGGIVLPQKYLVDPAPVEPGSAVQAVPVERCLSERRPRK